MESTPNMINPPLSVGGIILAGGLSRRMGRPKAWLDFHGEPLLLRVATLVAQTADPVVVATKRDSDIPPLPRSVQRVFDPDGQEGPLAGIASGMRALKTRCDAVLVVPCDHPFIQQSVVAHMIERIGTHSAVVAEQEGVLLPTFALYRMDALAIAEQLLETGERRAWRFAERCNPIRMTPGDLSKVDPEGRSFINLNDEAGYHAAMQLVPSNIGKPPSCVH